VLTLAGMTFTTIDLAAVFASWAALGLLALFLTRSKAGTMLRAVASNPEKATFIGIHTHRIFVLAFALGSFLMGLAAFVSTLEMPATPYVGMQALLMSFITVFLGGVGSLVGTVLGGLALGILESMVLLFLPTQFKLVVTFAVLFLVIIVRPEGFLGEKTS
jgi:branched-chain amino acid transport system permease protein